MSVILIVDPDDVARRALFAALRREDSYDILEAVSGPEALAMLRAYPVDLVIAEYGLGEMNGLEFMRHARAVRPDALRIMLAGHADLDVAVAAINEGAVYRFLFKPWEAFDLRVMIKLALRHLASLRASGQVG